ncbi:hypothetical protein KM043_011812 [Ampulex compressa]|nr:hypothetical protein KM043_011812 [Ampulex compressa]
MVSRRETCACLEASKGQRPARSAMRLFAGILQGTGARMREQQGHELSTGREYALSSVVCQVAEQREYEDVSWTNISLGLSRRFLRKMAEYQRFRDFGEILCCVRFLVINRGATIIVTVVTPIPRTFIGRRPKIAGIRSLFGFSGCGIAATILDDNRPFCF